MIEAHFIDLPNGECHIVFGAESEAEKQAYIDATCSPTTFEEDTPNRVFFFRDHTVAKSEDFLPFYEGLAEEMFATEGRIHGASKKGEDGLVERDVEKETASDEEKAGRKLLSPGRSGHAWGHPDSRGPRPFTFRP